MTHPAIKNITFTAANETYRFSVEGRIPFTCQAKDAGTAFGKANDYYGSLPQGAWMDSPPPTKRTYRWAPGNFFD